MSGLSAPEWQSVPSWQLQGYDPKQGAQLRGVLWLRSLAIFGRSARGQISPNFGRTRLDHGLGQRGFEMPQGSSLERRRGAPRSWRGAIEPSGPRRMSLGA